ncbi:MAG: hypothetical protein BMS9Abin28_2095 [Anaerolineae bacterium]|nr:MAG: hypothetical protein BMS9Abin28_2095 [Anaerolineae bacterium]
MNRKFYILGGLVVGALVMAACQPAETFECDDPIGCVDIAEGEPIHIAYMLTTSGATAFLGDDSIGGIEIAIDERGQIFGRDILLTGEDSLCSAEGGQTAATRVAADPTVLAAIGTNCSSAGEAASAVLSDAGMLMMSPTNTSPSLTDPAQTYFPGYFRTAHNDKFQGAVAARFAITQLGADTAATIHDGSPYADGLQAVFAEEFEKLGGTVTFQGAVNVGDTDMNPILTTISADSPDVLYFPIFEPEGDFIAAQSRDVPGLENTILFGADGLLVASFAPNTGPAAEGMYLSGPYVSEDIPEYAAFLKTYEANTGGPPPAGFAAHAYDATNIILDAIEAVAVESDDGTLHVGRQALRDWITNLTGFDGLTGTLACGDRQLAGIEAKGECATGEALAIYQLGADQVASADNWPAPVVWLP